MKLCFKQGYGTSYTTYLEGPGSREVQAVEKISMILGSSIPLKNGRQSDRRPQNTGKVKNPKPVPLGASQGF